MFDPTDRPRVFALPPGVDFASELVAGLTARAGDLSRTRIFVNTARMQRRLRAVFDAGPARLLPQIRLVTDLGFDPAGPAVPAPISPLRRRLELTQVIAQLLDRDPSIAPRAALYDLADSLAKLMDEMHGEGVAPGAISALDVTDQSGHWQRALKVLQLLEPYFDTSQEAPDAQARQRMIITGLIDHWGQNPPTDPIIVAGSTGSRGATGLFMQAVAKLPQGAVILPGFDFDMPAPVWTHLAEKMTSEDHPQYRFHTLMDALGLTPNDIARWSDATPSAPGRNRLVSLSLRPAPVTDQWLSDGPGLGDLLPATQDLTLVQAASPREEAEAIALRLRQAAQDGVTAALITPDRMLTRQVAAALDRWDITPDDSAGVPLPQSAPGRFLRQVTDLLGRPVQAETLLAILKHPLCHTGHPARNTHLLLTREFELALRRRGPPAITPQVVTEWVTSSTHDHAVIWGDWLAACLTGLDQIGTDALATHLARHLFLADQLAAGPATEGSGGLYDKPAGREAQRVVNILRRDADAGGAVSPADYATLFNAVLGDGVVRDRDAGHPGILIWGTLEARVGGADLLILGGLNDGTWPEAPTPDPWLNRVMRDKAGLLLPERRIGLSAHDYQQAIAAPQVVLTRSKRSAESETVPSRWLNRLTNLLSGLPKQNGPQALAEMTERGDVLLAQSAALALPTATVDKANRPAPQPPVDARPKELSVTQIKTLIRDPYAIYARKVLRLNPLDPLQAQADAPLRGVIYHAILEEFINSRPDAADPAALEQLLDIARQNLKAGCPWPTVRLQWTARMEKIAPVFLADEALRQSLGALLTTEGYARIPVDQTGVDLICKADRIDQTEAGEALIYDYKTGQVPTVTQQEHFDKQLLLTAAMAERGAFGDTRMTVAEAAFLGINADTKVVKAPLEKLPPDQVWAEFVTLLDRWADPTRGYTARLAMFSKDDHSQYEHLSRFGEWTMADMPEPEDLT